MAQFTEEQRQSDEGGHTGWSIGEGIAGGEVRRRKRRKRRRKGPCSELF